MNKGKVRGNSTSTATLQRQNDDCLVWSCADSLGSVQGEHGDHRNVDTGKMRHRSQRQGDTFSLNTYLYRSNMQSKQIR